jgi:hypothetical protein
VYIIDYDMVWTPNGFGLSWYHKSQKRLSVSERTTFDIKHIQYILKYTAPRKVREGIHDAIDELTDGKANIRLRDVIEFLYTGLYVEEDDCEYYPWECLHMKQFVRGNRIESYDLDKPLDKSKLHNLLRGFVVK